MKINWETGIDMTRHACGTTVVLLYLSLAVPVLGQNYFLYAPKPVNAEEQAKTKEGILVREMTVQKGDTLSGLSHKFSGRSSYFPQILLFNDIKNPNLIYIGDSIKVPVSKGEATVRRKPSAAVAPKQKTTARPAAQPVGELTLSDLKKPDATRSRKRTQRERKQVQRTEAKKQHLPAAAIPAKSTTGAIAKETVSGHKLYDQAFAAYRQGDCKTAIELFDRYLADNSTAIQASDASLYKADCYLKLSGQ
jgi:LysM repeat protein